MYLLSLSFLSLFTILLNISFTQIVIIFKNGQQVYLRQLKN